MTKSDREWIQREFDLTREVIKEHHEALRDHIQADERFQVRVLRTAKWAVSGAAATGIAAVGWLLKG